jgi:hypothetical protein
MNRRDHALVAGGAFVCFALAVFQVWYVALPDERAARLDVCRWSRHLDCFESLNRNGVALLPVLAALAAVFLLQGTLAALAATAPAPRGEAWLGLARLASFPATGLAVYVLLADLVFRAAAGPPGLDPLKTSPSAVLITLLSVGLNVHAVVRGRLGFRLRDAGPLPVAVAAAAALFGFFSEGAAGAAREAAAIQARVDVMPPTVLVPAFEPQIPRQGAASIGDLRAPREVLLFLDPAQEASVRILRDALAANAQGVLFQIYLRDRALPSDGRALLERLARGEPLPPAEPSPHPARAAAAARITEWPTAIWKEGRRAGSFALADIN